AWGLCARQCAPICRQVGVSSVAVARRRGSADAAADAGEEASLQSHDAGYLPTAQHICQYSVLFLKEWQRVHITHRKHLPSIEIRIALVERRIERYAQVRSFGVEVIQRLAPGVRETHRKATRHAPLRAELHSVVTRRTGILLRANRTVTQQLSDRVGAGVDECTRGFAR